MRHLDRMKFSVKDIVTDCASGFRDESLKEKYISSAEYIEQKSKELLSLITMIGLIFHHTRLSIR